MAYNLNLADIANSFVHKEHRSLSYIDDYYENIDNATNMVVHYLIHTDATF